MELKVTKYTESYSDSYVKWQRFIKNSCLQLNVTMKPCKDFSFFLADNEQYLMSTLVSVATVEVNSSGANEIGS